MAKLDAKVKKMLGLSGKKPQVVVSKGNPETIKFTKNNYVETDVSEVMYPNAGLIDIYADGKAFKISDNTKLYEVIKVVKDIIDFQFYNKGMTTISFGFGINVGSNCAIFTISFNDNQAQSPDTPQPLDFAESLAEKIEFEIKRRFLNSVDVEKNIRPLITSGSGFNAGDTKTEVVIIAREKTTTKGK